MSRLWRVLYFTSVHYDAKTTPLLISEYLKHQGSDTGPLRATPAKFGAIIF